MKKLILGAALAVSAAVPAFAQTVIIEPEIREYVVREGRASSVEFRGDLAVGTVLPSDIEVYEIDVGQPVEYRYAVVNNRRVIVDPDTRKIVEIVD